MLKQHTVLCKTSSGLGRRDGRREGNHPKVNDINQFGEMNRGRIAPEVARSTDWAGSIGSSPEAIKWFQDNMGMNAADAEKAANIFLKYSKRGDTPLHNDTDKAGNDLLDKIIHTGNAPVYSGNQFRGMHITGLALQTRGVNVTPEQYIQGIIKGGVWKDAGATSFSASERVAHGFANSQSVRPGDASVILHYEAGKSGFPMQHLSSYPGEREVLHSRAQMRKGMKIASSRTEKNKRGGTIYHIYLTD